MNGQLSVSSARVRYRFGGFVVSAGQRHLLREGTPVPLIPRYFDLLVVLLERRHEAVHRRELLERVWTDVVVSDGALSQAVRTLRRTLGEDGPRPVFIRTVSRHGYQFVFPDVLEEPDEGPLQPGPQAPAEPTSTLAPQDDLFEPHLARLVGPWPSHPDDESDPLRESAEALHALGTAEALERLGRRPGHERARALLRDARWDVPGSGPVPLVGVPGGLKALAVLLAIRSRRAAKVAEKRWVSAAGGGALAGAVAGSLGSVALLVSPGSVATASVLPALAMVGVVVGGLGAAGVGAGLAAAEALVRSYRRLALVALGSLGGGLIGALAHEVGRMTLEGLFGHGPTAVGGAFEGLGLGAAAGLGYSLATPRPEGGMAAPRGAARARAALVTGLACALGGVLLTVLGASLTGVSLHALARSFQGSQVELLPLARLLGDRGMGPTTRGVLGAWEGFFFGTGLAFGLTRRPR